MLGRSYLLDSTLSVEDKAILATSPILYAPLLKNLKDLIGGLTATTVGATYTDGTGAFFDGNNDSLNLYSWGLDSVWSGANFTIDVKIMMSSSSIWTDGANHTIIRIFADADNFTFLNKSSTSNTVLMRYEGSNTTSTITVGSQSSTSFIRYTLTKSAVLDELRGFVDGTQSGSTLSTLGTYVGAALSAANTCVGADNNTATPTGDWSGWIKRVAIWNRALTPAQVAALPA